MTVRTREWLRSFLRLDARAQVDNIPSRDILRQEDTVLGALEVLEERPGVVIADEVGMGKTFEAIGVVAAFRRQSPKSRVVIITPGPDLNSKWAVEFERFSDARVPLYDFGDDVRAATTLADFIEAARTRKITIAPVTIFHSVKGGADQAYLLSLYFHWKGVHGHTVNAVLSRFRDGRLGRVDVAQELFLGRFAFNEVEKHLDKVFRGSDKVGLDQLYEEAGYEAFARVDAVRRALDGARFRLVRALIPAFDLLVIDEAHKLKNADTQRANAVTTVFDRRFDKALFLTATPFQLDVAELRQVFALFALAKSAPRGLMDEADRLFADIRDYQAAYEAFRHTWRALDEAGAQEFADWFAHSPDLGGDAPSPSLQKVSERFRELKRLKDRHIEPQFRAWMIRSLREDKRVYRRHQREARKPAGDAILPFLLYERFIAELFRSEKGTHKSAVEINMVSSYGAARTGSLFSEDGRALGPAAEGYRQLLKGVLDDVRPTPIDHPKLQMVIDDSLAAVERGEKTLVFCARTETLKELRGHIKERWDQRMLAAWQRLYPGAAREEIFDRTDDGSKGRHALLQARFGRAQDALYLALRERYLRSLIPVATWALAHLDSIVVAANERLRTVRVSTASARRLDYRLLKRIVEQAAMALLVAERPSVRQSYRDAVDALLAPEFLTLGLDLQRDAYEHEELGTEAPTWTIHEEQAALVIGERRHLWEHVFGELGSLDRSMRVALVEQLARYLTYRQVTFLVDLLSAAQAAGMDVEHIESHALLAFIDEFWETERGAVWVERLRSFIRYFDSRHTQQRRDLLDGPLQQGLLVRETQDGESRERLREAFNTPLYPMILIANEVMQEGLDLHRECRRVIHHDLSWNPAQLEQRVGRVDRLGSYTFRCRQANPEVTLDVLYPLIQRTVDIRLFRTVKTREKWLEFLLGAPPNFEEFSLDETSGPDLPAAVAQALVVDLQPRPVALVPKGGGFRSR